MECKTQNEIRLWVNLIPIYEIKFSEIKKHYKIMLKDIMKDVANPRVKRYYQRRKVIYIAFERIVDGIKMTEINEIWIWWDPKVNNFHLSQAVGWRGFELNGKQYEFSNQKHIMGVGYRARLENAFTKVNNRDWAAETKSYYQIEIKVPKVANTNYADRFKHEFKTNKYNNDFLKFLIRKTNNYNEIKRNLSQPIFETAFRQGWWDFLKANGKHWSMNFSKPISAFEYDWKNKEYFNTWFKWARSQKNYNHRLWLDYLDIKNRFKPKLGDFDNDWIDHHDALQEKQENHERRLEIMANRMRSRENKYYKNKKFSRTHFTSIPAESINSVRGLGHEIKNCLRYRQLNLEKEKYYKIEFKKYNFALAVGYYPFNKDDNDKDMIDAHNLGGRWEIYGVKDNTVPSRLKNIIKKEILKEAQRA